MLTAMQTEGSEAETPSRWNVLVVEDDRNARAFFEASVRRCPQLRWLDGLGTARERSRQLCNADRRRRRHRAEAHGRPGRLVVWRRDDRLVGADLAMSRRRAPYR